MLYHFFEKTSKFQSNLEYIDPRMQDGGKKERENKKEILVYSF